ncbi:hypothetical protein J6I39_02935 [bacterium]|nr:hypothetical protein [bacterium]
MSLSVEQINKLESENERLTKEVKQWKYEYEMLDACCELYSAKLQDFKEKNEKLIRALLTRQKMLQEIEEIARQKVSCINFDQAKTCTEVEYDYARIVHNLEQRMSKILQKISEVNNEQNNSNT